MSEITYDAWLRVAECLADRHDSLASLARVNRLSNQAASKVLYRSVSVSPAYERVLDLKKRDKSLPQHFIAARLAHNATHVLSLEISGFLSMKPSPRNNFADILGNAIRQWTNLQSVSLTPHLCHEDVFSMALQALQDCKNLRSLAVNASCCDDKRSILVTRIENLETLVIDNPTRVILQSLPEWLARLENVLNRFFLKNNCGSVTPGVLKSFLPGICKIQSFGLGLSYSIVNDDIFAFVSQLHSLVSLNLRYYTQLRTPSVRPYLPLLESFTVHHNSVVTRIEAGHLIKWVRGIIRHSPIQNLHLVPEQKAKTPDVSFDGLVHHLRIKHTTTLQVLRLDSAFIGLSALRALCTSCSSLRELGVRTHRDVFVRFSDIFYHCNALRELILSTTRSRSRRYQLSEKNILEFMQQGRSSLRVITLNGHTWEGSWSTSATGVIYFEVSELQ